MITLKDYETQTFTKEQEDAINVLNGAIEDHFRVMGVDPTYTNIVWECIDQIITEQILTNYEED